MVPDSMEAANGKERTLLLPVGDIVPDPDQPRKTFTDEALRSLAHSLRETGQISPIVVSPGPGGKYVIVVGERRWRAAKEAGLARIECVVRSDLDGQLVRDMQMAENHHREDIPPLEQARSLKTYLDKFQVSQSELSRRTGIPQRTISDRLALLALPASVHARVESGEIGPYEALKISALPADRQEAAAEAVSSSRTGGRALQKGTRRGRSMSKSAATGQASQRTGALETAMGLLERVENLEKALYRLTDIYSYNEIERQTKGGGSKAPPCPECAKRGNNGWIQVFRRRMTSEDRSELIKCLKEAGNSDNDIGEMMKPEPTHVTEARCRECGRTEFIGYVTK